jgi:hypothetical protein
MLFAASGGVTVLITTLALCAAGLIGWIARAFMNLVKTRQSKARDDERAERTLSAFLFDQERDPRTGTPATTGWTTRVDQTLSVLTSGQARTEAAQVRTERAVHQILEELRPDGNGGHNLRGLVERSAEAAGVEVGKQTKERT